MQTGNQAGALRQLTLALLAPESLEELLLAAESTIPAALAFNGACSIVLSDPLDSRSDDAARLQRRNVTVPIVQGQQTLGRLVLHPAHHLSEPDMAHLEQRATELSSLLAAAINARQRVERHYEELQEETAKLKFDIVAMLSHEMRTPLTSIKGYASALLLDDVEWDASQRREFITAIEEESDRLTGLVTEILDSAVIDAGELRIQTEPVLLPHIARQVVDKFTHHNGPHRIAVSFAERFPIVEADAQRIEQVLTNLIDNAIKYSPDGGLIVVRGEYGDDEVVVSVSDEGVGIAPEHLNKLFERFFRAKTSGQPAVVGTGLGLPIVDAIVRAHGGRIWAESTVGRGTTLSFTLRRTEPLAGDQEP